MLDADPTDPNLLIGCTIVQLNARNTSVSASDSYPSSTCSVTAAAVNILPSEPDWKTVWAPAGT
jgi:hypothetical protein